MYRSPKYWKEMARARKEHEAKIKREAEREATSHKQQASSVKLQAHKATSGKHQAPSSKLQAQSRKQQDP